MLDVEYSSYFNPTGHCVEKDLEWKFIKVKHGHLKNEKVHEVSKILLHPKFARPKIPHMQYDIAILKLEAPVQTTNFFLCLPSNNQDQYVGQNVAAMGWGLTSLDHIAPSKVMKAASYTVMDNPSCRKAFENRSNEFHKAKDPLAPYVFFYLHPYVICAMSNKPKSSACMGDSGGRFFNN